MPLKIQEIKSGEFYKNGSNETCYVLHIVFEDTIQKHKKTNQLGDLETIQSIDHIVFRKLNNGRYDMPHTGKYSWLIGTEKFDEQIEMPILFNKETNRHYFLVDNISYDYELICGPVAFKKDLGCRAKPYRFPYQILLGQELPGEKSNFNLSNIPQIVDILENTLGFESFVYFKHLMPSMYGGALTTMGFWFCFKTEENYNLARLIFPKIS